MSFFFLVIINEKTIIFLPINVDNIVIDRREQYAEYTNN
jgi:hypothetical protein